MLREIHNHHFFQNSQICITKFEFETLEQSLALEITNAVTLVVICVLINRIGKFPILCKFLINFLTEERPVRLRRFVGQMQFSF